MADKIEHTWSETTECYRNGWNSMYLKTKGLKGSEKSKTQPSGKEQTENGKSKKERKTMKSWRKRMLERMKYPSLPKVHLWHRFLPSERQKFDSKGCICRINPKTQALFQLLLACICHMIHLEGPFWT